MYSVAVLLARRHAHLHLLLLLLHLPRTTPPINPRTPTHGSKEDESGLRTIICCSYICCSRISCASSMPAPIGLYCHHT